VLSDTIFVDVCDLSLAWSRELATLLAPCPVLELCLKLGLVLYRPAHHLA